LVTPASTLDKTRKLNSISACRTLALNRRCLNKEEPPGRSLVKIDLVKRAFKEDSGEGVQLRSLVLLGTVRPKARSIRRNDYR